jgi:hypothetical protein
MVYSAQFAALPPLVKNAVLVELKKQLSEHSTMAHISLNDRNEISQILRETLPGFP